jgi:hypothetical protein
MVKVKSKICVLIVPISTLHVSLLPSVLTRLALMKGTFDYVPKKRGPPNL